MMNAVIASGNNALTDFLTAENVASQPSLIRGMLTEPEFRAGITNDILGRCEARERHSRNRPSYETRACASSDLVDRLQRSYPEFKVESKVANDMTGHPYSKDSRHLDSRLVWDIFICKNKDVIIGRAYDGSMFDVLVKDVGGSIIEVFHTQKRLEKFHSCTPVACKSDVNRFYNTQKFLSLNVANYALKERSAVARRTLQSHLTADGVNRCSLMAEHCPVTAPFLTFIHSSYDISVDGLVAILDSAKCNQAYFVFLFDPHILSSDSEGMIPYHCVRWSKLKINNTDCIRFDFNDGQDSYVHRMDTYLALLGIARLHSRKVPGRSYLFTLTRYVNNTCYITCSADVRKVATAEYVARCIPFEVGSSMVYIRAYGFSSVDEIQVKPRTILVSSDFWEKVLNSARTLAQGKFTYTNVLTHAISHNCTAIIGATTVASTRYPSDVVADLAALAWLHIYIRNYETGKLLQITKEDEDNIRRHNLRSRFSKMLLKVSMKRNTKAHCSNNAKHPHSDQVESTLTKSELSDSFMCIAARDFNKVSFYDRVCSFLFGDLNSVRKYPIEIVSAGASIDFQLHLRELVTEKIDSYYPFISKPSLDNVVDTAAAHSTIATICRNAAVQSALMIPPIVKTKCDCDDLLETVSVPGDGNCFYHSLAVLLELPSDVSAIKRRLLNSSFLSKTQIHRDVVRRLTAVEGSDAWANNDVILLAAYEYRVAICVHSENEVVMLFNADAPSVIHVEHKKLHFQPLLQKVDSPMLMSVVLPTSLSEVSEDVVLESYNSWLTPLLKDSNDTSVRHDLSIRSTIYHKYNVLRSCGYSTDYGVLLAAAIKVSDLGSARLRVLDVNPGRGTSLQVFVDKLRAEVVSLQFSASAVVDVNGAYETVVGRPDTPVQCLKGVATFDVIAFNPSRYFDSLACMDFAKFDRDLTNNLPLLSFLNFGGTLIIGYPVTPTPRSLKILCDLTTSFDTVRIVRSQFVPPHNPWLIVVCKGYNGNSTAPGIFTSVYDIFQAIINKLKPVFNNAVSDIVNSKEVPHISHREYDHIMRELELTPNIAGGSVFRNIPTFALPTSFDMAFAEKFGLEPIKCNFRVLKKYYELQITRNFIDILSKVAGVHSPVLLSDKWFAETNQKSLNKEERAMLQLLYAMHMDNEKTLKTSLVFDDIIIGGTTSDCFIHYDLGYAYDQLAALVSRFFVNIANTAVSFVREVNVVNERHIPTKEASASTVEDNADASTRFVLSKSHTGIKGFLLDLVGIHGTRAISRTSAMPSYNLVSDPQFFSQADRITAVIDTGPVFASKDVPTTDKELDSVSLKSDSDSEECPVEHANVDLHKMFQVEKAVTRDDAYV